MEEPRRRAEEPRERMEEPRRRVEESRNQPHEEWSQGMFPVSAEELVIRVSGRVVHRIQGETTSILQSIGQPVQAIVEKSKRKVVRARNSDAMSDSIYNLAGGFYAV
jgi:hypothetical protein